MKFLNHYNGIFLFFIIFIIWAYYDAGKNCPCTINKEDIPKYCKRVEFYGIQLNHLYLYILLGICFPSYFYTLQLMGILWELVEIMLDKYPNFAMKYFNGCLATKPKNKKENPLYNYEVYRDEEKYVNPIDKLFNIENSKIHGWHGSVAEILTNMIGFFIGKIIYKNYLTLII